MRITAFLLAIAFTLPIGANAQDKPGEIVVTGIGHASAPPDKARLRIEVSARDRQSEAAMEQITMASDTVMAVLTAYGVSEADIETTSLSLNENWEYEDDKRVFKGFSASTSLSADIRDLTRIGNLVATLSKDGATSIRGPYFEIEDKVALRNDARRNAVRDGLATAELLAEAAGVTLGPPLLITDGTRASDKLTLEDVMEGTVHMEEPMVMEEPALEGSVAISETGVAVAPADIETMETVKLIFRIDP